MDKYQKRNLVLQELSKLPFFQIKETEVIIFCPFHDDKGHPNCGVNIGPEANVGDFFCWRCGVSKKNRKSKKPDPNSGSGSWNKLARKLGLIRFPAENDDSYEEEDPFNSLALNLDEVKVEEYKPYSKPLGLQRWVGDWRGISGDFLRSLGAKEWYDKKSEAYRIWFPVTHFGELVGHVAGRLDKTTQPNNRNSYKLPTNVLFLADFIKGDKVIITEGPYDAIRLQSLGLPAASILGVPHWGEGKINTITAYGFKTVLAAGDNDDAGYELNFNVKHDLEAGFNVDYFGLPYEEDIGKKMDPGDMPLKYVKLLQQKLESM